MTSDPGAQPERPGNNGQAPVNARRLRRLYKRLLDIYSPSGKEEEIVEYLHGYLKRHGLPVLRQEVDDYRENLIVLPPNREPALAFIGHVDTVTAYDLEEFGYQEEGDRITGLGAADMKGGCAAMIEAVTCLWERRLSDGPLMLALVVGEEEEGDGARRLTKEYGFPWAVIGEPTSLRPCLSHFGYLELQLNTEGRLQHASLAKRGHNAVGNMLNILLRLTEYLEGRRPELIYNIRDLNSSGGGFVVPDGCGAWIDLHLPPASPVSEVAMEIEDLLARERQANPALQASLRFTTVQAGYDLPDKGPLVQTLREVMRDLNLEWLPDSFRSHSDANELWSNGVKPVIFGPGHLEQAHRPDEYASFAQVLTAAEIYYQTAYRIISAGQLDNY
jgi:acetylornithine deacetylase